MIYVPDSCYADHHAASTATDPAADGAPLNYRNADFQSTTLFVVGTVYFALIGIAFGKLASLFCSECSRARRLRCVKDALLANAIAHAGARGGVIRRTLRAPPLGDGDLASACFAYFHEPAGVAGVLRAHEIGRYVQEIVRDDASALAFVSSEVARSGLDPRERAQRATATSNANANAPAAPARPPGPGSSVVSATMLGHALDIVLERNGVGTDTGADTGDDTGDDAGDNNRAVPRPASA